MFIKPEEEAAGQRLGQLLSQTALPALRSIRILGLTLMLVATGQSNTKKKKKKESASEVERHGRVWFADWVRRGQFEFEKYEIIM